MSAVLRARVLAQRGLATAERAGKVLPAVQVLLLPTGQVVPAAMDDLGDVLLWHGKHQLFSYTEAVLWLAPRQLRKIRALCTPYYKEAYGQ